MGEIVVKNEYTWDEVMAMQTRQDCVELLSKPADSVVCCNLAGKAKQKLGILMPAENAAVALGTKSKVGY